MPPAQSCAKSSPAHAHSHVCQGALAHGFATMGCAQGSSGSIIHVRRSGKHFSFKSGIENSRACSLKIELGDATAQAVSTGTHPVVEHAGHNLVPVEDGEVDQGGLPRTPLLNVLHIHGRRPAHFSSGAPAFGQPHMCMKRLGDVLPLQALLSVHKTHQYPLLPYTQCYIHPIPYMYPTYIVPYTTTTHNSELSWGRAWGARQAV